ncbi:clan AA aspartic protease [Candidatus Woesebacteria bacterium]|nr:clan AA aspartic protease [Candidatus Woesebacteria bacterium]
MGVTTVRLKVSNLKDPKKSIEDKFLVDSGASITVLPADIVKELGIKPIFEKEFILADGKVVKRKIGSALVKFKGIEIPTQVVLGGKNDSKLLGALTLEGMGLALDPFERRLYKARLTL